MIKLTARVRALAGRAATLVSYSHPCEDRRVHGVAVLDEDELVLFSAPGAMPWHELEELARDHGLACESRRYAIDAEARIALARRASGWHGPRPTGPPEPRDSALPPVHPLDMANSIRFARMITNMWRNMRAGRAHARLNRPRVARGGELPRLDGQACRLLSRNGGPALESEYGPHLISQADLLLRYTLEPDLRGLIVFGGPGRPLVHLPGKWDPEKTRHFAVRNTLGYEARALSREEYLALTDQVLDAVP
ncbi:hypothetical protein [Streptosporangium sp. NPDC002524]|uniref:hypothetical protein n=1 Tax=Streptosporangium sp. NPDC002524 TaxID=3154537 RepID=UPI003328CC2B